MKCAVCSSISDHSNKVTACFFSSFSTFILYHELRTAAALHTKDYCITGTIPPHDIITPGKRDLTSLSERQCQSLHRMRFLQSTCNIDTKTTSEISISSEIIVGPTDPLARRILGLKLLCSSTRTKRSQLVGRTAPKPLVWSPFVQTHQNSLQTPMYTRMLLTLPEHACSCIAGGREHSFFLPPPRLDPLSVALRGPSTEPGSCGPSRKHRARPRKASAPS